VQGFLLHRPQPLSELLAAAEDAVPA